MTVTLKGSYLDGDTPDGMTLENLVDTYGLLRILDTLGDICEAKAEHIRASYSDEKRARKWSAKGKALYHALGLTCFKED